MLLIRLNIIIHRKRNIFNIDILKVVFTIMKLLLYIFQNLMKSKLVNFFQNVNCYEKKFCNLCNMKGNFCKTLSAF